MRSKDVQIAARWNTALNFNFLQPISLRRVHKGHDAIWRHWAVKS